MCCLGRRWSQVGESHEREHSLDARGRRLVRLTASTGQREPKQAGDDDRAKGESVTEARSSLAHVAAEHGLHVHDRRPVDRLEIAHPKPEPVALEDLDPVDPDWVRPIR